MKIKKLIVAMGLALGGFSQAGWAVTPQAYTSTGVNTWQISVDSTTTGATGSITFNDWGYIGPNGSGWNYK